MEILRDLIKADRLRFLVGLGSLLLGGAGFIVYKDVEYNLINSAIISALAVFGLTLMIAGLLINSRFTEWGMIDLRWFQDEQDMRTLLSKCKKEVIILKTWFPEDGEIAAGLAKAFQNQAKVRLILCHPNA